MIVIFIIYSCCQILFKFRALIVLKSELDLASFFTMNYFAGFEVLNTILLLSFIMGIVLFPRE